MALVTSLDGHTYDLDPELLEKCRIPDEQVEALHLPALPTPPPTRDFFIPGPHPWIRLGPAPDGGSIIHIGPPPFGADGSRGPAPQVFVQGRQVMTAPPPPPPGKPQEPK